MSDQAFRVFVQWALLAFAAIGLVVVLKADLPMVGNVVRWYFRQI